MKYFFAFLFFNNFIFAQTLSSSLDKPYLDLGETATLTIRIQNLHGKDVISAQKKGLLPFNFEEYKDEIIHTPEQYIRTIEFTLYDEGKFSIPPLEFKIGDSIHKTIPYEIEVKNPVQKNDKINDIMPNKEVKLQLTDYWELYQKYVFLILGVIIGILIFFKRRTKNSKNLYKNTINSLNLLEELQNKNLIEKKEFRLFYIDLLDIIRQFLTEKYQIPAEILLTDDLIDLIQKSTLIPNENKNILVETFTRGDLVKFAKTIPEKNIIENDFKQIKTLITNSFNSKTND